MKKKNKVVKFISSLVLILIIVPFFLFSKPKQVQAFLGFGDIVTDPITEIETTSADLSDVTIATQTTANLPLTSVNTGLHIKDFAEYILRQVITSIEHKLLQQLTQGTVNWINSGFSGSPLFVQNPGSFFGDIAKYEVKNTIDMIGYDTVGFPFGKATALNIINQYKATSQNDMQYSLSRVINDPVFLNNYRNNFSTGGWNGFLINTQYPQNNYIGFQMLTTDQLARQLQGTSQNAAQKVATTLSQGNGFLAPQSCASNPSYNNGVNEFKHPSFDSSAVPYNVPDCIPPPSGASSVCVNQAAITEEEKNNITPEKCIYNLNVSGTTDTGCINQTEITAALDAYNNAYNTAKTAWDKTNSCPGGLSATTPGSVVANQITTALGSTFRQSELGAAMGNSIGAVLDALMNHFLQEGLNGLSKVVQSAPSVDNWSYGGQTLTGTTTTTSQALNIPTSVSVQTGKSTSTTISGGTASYSIQTQPDTTIATAQVSGSTLSVTGVTAGQTSVIIQDSSSPVKTATIQITTSKSGTLTIDFNNPSALQNISTGVQGSTNLNISSGIQPYNLITQPDSSVAIALISTNTLTIVGVSPGTSSLVLQDSSSSPKTITLQITVGNETPLVVNPQNISIGTISSTGSATISGGAAPYNVVTQPNSSIASANIPGNILTVFGKAIGTTSVTIQDSYSPAETITIPITVGGGTTTGTTQ